MLVDHATLTVCSGKGGDGSNNLHHAKGVAKGGPDGGDGGNGGDVVLVGDPHLDTLASYARRRLITAEDGEKGRKKACYGKRGETLELPLPLGCQVFDTSNDELLVDVISEGQRFMVAAGGKGGAATFISPHQPIRRLVSSKRAGSPSSLRFDSN